MRIRNRTLLLFLAATCVLCSSCVVRSLHPWFSEAEATFDEELLGGWVGVNDGVAMTFVRDGNSYLIQYSSSSEESFGRGYAAFRAKLARIAGESYLDFEPAQEDRGPALDGLFWLKTHSVAHVEVAHNTLTIRLLDYDKIKAAARKGELKEVRGEWLEDELLIVSREEELRRFLIAGSATQDLFGKALKLVRKK